VLHCRVIITGGNVNKAAAGGGLASKQQLDKKRWTENFGCILLCCVIIAAGVSFDGLLIPSPHLAAAGRLPLSTL
jgi:hypothetical protein